MRNAGTIKGNYGYVFVPPLRNKPIFGLDQLTSGDCNKTIKPPYVVVILGIHKGPSTSTSIKIFFP